MRLVEQLPEAYIEAYLALEPGQRYDVRQEHEHAGRRGRAAHAPLPLDVEADALMGRILEVVLSWHEVVAAAAGLSGVMGTRLVAQERLRWAPELAVERTTSPRLEDETERGDFAALRCVRRVEAIDRPADSTAGVALTTACRLLAAHVDVLLELPPTPVVRTVPHRGVVRAVSVPVPSTGDAPRWTTIGVPHLSDDTLGHVHADGRAMVVRELDGVDAALELFALRRDVRRTLGQSRGATVFDRPCPNPECGQPGLVLLQGADEVVCGACGERWSASDYDRLSAVLNSDRQRDVS